MKRSSIITILSWILMTITFFITFAGFTYFTLAYGWKFTVWVFAMVGLILLDYLLAYNWMKRR